MKKSDFKVLDDSAYELFESFRKSADTMSCERSWANLQLYSDTYQWQWHLEDDRFWIASFQSSYMFYPLGKPCPPELLLAELSDFRSICLQSVTCGDLPYDYAEQFPEAANFFHLQDDPGDYDYIYDLEHLRSFSGSKLRKRHNQVRQFERDHAGMWRVEKLSQEHLPKIAYLAEKLSANYWTDSTGLEEKLAFEQLEKRFNNESLKLDGIVLMVNDQPAGFSIFSALDATLADIHFEKADRSFGNSSAALTACLAEYLSKNGFSFMNREQDLNEEGLRRAKRALDPAEQFKRLSIELP